MTDCRMPEGDSEQVRINVATLETRLLGIEKQIENGFSQLNKDVGRVVKANDQRHHELAEDIKDTRDRLQDRCD